MSRTRTTLIGVLAVALVAWIAPGAMSADPIRVAYIDPLSGPFAATGENGLNQFRQVADHLDQPCDRVLLVALGLLLDILLEPEDKRQCLRERFRCTRRARPGRG